MVNSATLFSAKQLTIVNYICVYIRFVKDGSLLLALLAWGTVNLSEFMGNVIGAYQQSISQPHSEGLQEGVGRFSVVRAIVFKGLIYTQVILVLQVIYALLYHMRMDLEGDFCRHRYGYVILLLVGEQDCGRGGRWILLALDWAILFTQLVLIAMELTPQNRGNCQGISQLDTDRYGILAILKFNPWSEPSAVQQLPVTRRHRYGSI